MTKAATKTLDSLGYSWNGGELWKPPIGPTPDYIAWNGEGLPPVKTVCEALIPDVGWREVTICGHNLDGERAFYNGSCLIGWATADKFRPILTPKQRTIEAAMKHNKAHHWTRQEFIEELYNLGFVSMPGESE